MDREPEVGSAFGDFELVELLHSGPRASVYRAGHPSFGRDLALKIVAADDEALLAGVAALDVQHPNLITVYGHGRMNDYAWLAMRLITGVALPAWWAHTPLTLRDIASIVRQTASALDAIHAAGQTHGDVKPHNILVTTAAAPERLRAYLIDPVPSSSAYLTLDYAAPERLGHEPATAASDQYSLAAVAHHCLLGVPPFAGETAEKTAAAHVVSRLDPLPVSGAVADSYLAKALEVVLRTGLARNPLHRYASCSGLAAALDEAVAAPDVAAPPGIPKPRDADARFNTTARPPLPPPSAYAADGSATGYPLPAGTAEPGANGDFRPPRVPADPSYRWDGKVVTPGFGPERPEWAMLTSAGDDLITGEGLLYVLRMTSGAVATGTDHVAEAEDYVDCSVFAPREMSPGSSALVQVFVHLPDDARDVAKMATEFDERAERRGARTLEVPIGRGEILVFDLAIRGIEVPDPVQQLTWCGKSAAVQFEAVVPETMPVGQTTVGTLRVSRRGIPIGLLRFSVRIAAGAGGAVHELVGDEARRFTRAFVSYSSDDRAAVLARLQVLRAASIEYFQDVDLDPGQRWEKELYRQIDTCDLFLLFWSHAAKDSTWVRKEVGYALALGAKAPEIRPVVIEGPPVPKPWDELSHLHFNDRLLSMLAVAAQGKPELTG